MTQDHSAQHELRHSLESAGYDITNCSVKCEELRNHQQFHKHSFLPPPTRPRRLQGGKAVIQTINEQDGVTYTLHQRRGFNTCCWVVFVAFKAFLSRGFLLRFCPVFRGTFGTFSSFKNDTCWIFKWLKTDSTSGFYSWQSDIINWLIVFWELQQFTVFWSLINCSV